MAPRPPNAEDVRKLHGEVNQYINQRFLVAMTAITVSGVALGWMIQQAISMPSQPRASELIYSLALVLLAVLTVLFLVSLSIKKRIIVIASYLRVTGVSTWEQEYKRCGNQLPRLQGSGQKRVMTVIFSSLSILGCIAAFGLNIMMGEWLPDIVVLPIALAVLTVGYVGFVFSIDDELRSLSDRFDEDWERVKEE